MRYGSQIWVYLGESGGLSVRRNFKPAPRGRELFGGETGTEEQGTELAWRKEGAHRGQEKVRQWLKGTKLNQTKSSVGGVGGSRSKTAGRTSDGLWVAPCLDRGSRLESWEAVWSAK